MWLMLQWQCFSLACLSRWAEDGHLWPRITLRSADESLCSLLWGCADGDAVVFLCATSQDSWFPVVCSDVGFKTRPRVVVYCGWCRFVCVFVCRANGKFRSRKLYLYIEIDLYFLCSREKKQSLRLDFLHILKSILGIIGVDVHKSGQRIIGHDHIFSSISTPERKSKPETLKKSFLHSFPVSDELSPMNRNVEAVLQS